MTRLNARAAAVLVAAAVLLPAGVAHAALPIDTTTSGSRAASTSSAADEESDDAGYDEVAEDDDGSDDDTAVSDDDASTSSSADVDDDAAEIDDTASSARSSGSAGAGAGAAAKAHSVKKKAVKPRGVAARLTAFDRAVVTFRPSGSGVTRWIVTLRAGSTGRLMILGPKARSATFTALKASTRYTATVTAVAPGGRRASASDHVRTASLKKAVAQTRSEAERAVRESKAQRFG